MIQRISIRDVATFDSAGVTIDNFEKINIIYGSNGTGKSTISKVLSHIEDYNQCHIDWKDGMPMEVLTYNKEFCEKNYSEQMPGVFTLGEAVGEIMNEISDKKSMLEEIKKIGIGYKNEISKQENACNSEMNTFRDAAWNDLLKNHELFFPKSAIGAGTKDNFVSKLAKAYDVKYDSPLSIEDLKKRAKVMFGAQPSRQELIKEISPKSCIAIESNALWQRAIVGKRDIDIAGLIMRIGSSDWVNQGMNYIENGSDVCPFCQQHTITPEFKKKINSFFDDGYKKDVQNLDSLINDYSAISSNIILKVEETIRTQKEQERTFLDISSLESAVVALKLVIAGNTELINSKKKEPSRKVSLTSTTDILETINTIIQNANSAITDNNRLVDNFTNERSLLVKDIWNYFACLFSSSIESHYKRLNGINNAIKNLQEKKDKAACEYKEVSQELIALEQKVTSVTPTINEINKLLQAYGFNNFQIQEVPDNKNCYQIVRENGEPATATLSEGEKTFIMFLYYMQLVKGSHNPKGITTNRVLVIDDPVSSLDSNVLFVVSTLLREVFADIHKGLGSVKQAIILTHNVYFHKEIAFYDRNCKWRDCVNHWILRKRNNVSKIQAYGKSSPIKSSYELMWAELKSEGLNSCIVTQNIMRRIIENYFQVFGGISPDVILEKFSNSEEKKICRSLLSWVNDGSHSMPEDLFIEMSDEQLVRNKEVFHQIFIQMGQKAHYDMMMQQIDKEDESKICS
ncbi:MAG: AAA family ATPase [Bacteroidales bacterium]|nr:AAA family ATPase [Bacteroidales bacterium]